MRRKNTTSEMMKGYMADALLILMREKVYADITIGEITTKAGVNRSTFYRNFDSKDEIIKHYVKQIIYSHKASLPERQTSIEDYLLGMFAYYYGYKNELLMIHEAKVTYIMLDTFNETFSAIRADTTPEGQYATHYHTGGIYNTFLLWFEGGMTETPAEMAEITMSYYPANLRPYLWTK